MFDRNRAEDVEFRFLRLVLVANDALCIFILAAAEKNSKIWAWFVKEKKEQTNRERPKSALRTRLKKRKYF